MNLTTRIAPDATAVHRTPLTDAWSVAWACGYDAALDLREADPDCSPGFAAGYLAGLRALSLGATPTRRPANLIDPADLDVLNAENDLAAQVEMASQLAADAEEDARQADRDEYEADYRAWLDAIEADRQQDWHEDEVWQAGQVPTWTIGGER